MVSMKDRPRSFSLFAALVSILCLFASCGGERGSGSVALFLTDAPTTDFSRVDVTFTKVEAIGGSEAVILFEGEATYDLLTLRDRAVPFVTVTGVPAGSYEKLRLHVSSVQVYPAEGGGPVAVRLPSGHIDVVGSGPFRLSDGSTMTAMLDLDASQSIHLVENGVGEVQYVFRPVIFVNLDSPVTWGRRVSVYAQVKRVDAAAGRFELDPDMCDANPASLPRYGATADSPHAIRSISVRLATGASVFDGSGNPTTLAGMADNSWVTVTATPQTGETGGGDNAESFYLEADFVQLSANEYIGTGNSTAITRLGRVVSAPDETGSFTLGLINAGSDVMPSVVPVAPMTGSRIFTWWGTERRWADIPADALVWVDGFWNGSVLRSSQVYLCATGGGTPIDGLEGTVSAFDYADASFTLTPTGRSGGSTEPVRVRFLPRGGVGLVTAYYTGYSAIMGIRLADLQPGQIVCVYGWKAGDGIIYSWSTTAWPSDNAGLPRAPW